MHLNTLIKFDIYVFQYINKSSEYSYCAVNCLPVTSAGVQYIHRTSIKHVPTCLIGHYANLI